MQYKNVILYYFTLLNHYYWLELRENLENTFVDSRKILQQSSVAMGTASLPETDVMASAAGKEENALDNEPQLGPKATKIRERIRNITNE